MTNLTKLLLWTLLVINYLIPGTHSDVTVFPLSITVLEGNNATARCIYDGENKLQGVSMSLNQSGIATIFLPNCTFNTLGFDNYITDCEGNKTVVITLVNVSRNDHGKTLTCTVFVYNSPPIQSSSSTLLTVNVPVKTVIITSENAIGGLVSVCEKTFLSFRCKTSAVRPSPNISWIFQKKNSAEEIILDSSIILERDENHLDIASSTLNVTANISLNNWNIFCSASNILHEEVNSSKIHFNISYPPLQSPSIINLNIPNGETYNIIEGRQGLLTCTVPESNPNANLSWNGLDNRQAVENSIVTNTLEWTASRQDANILTCIAKHRCNSYEKSISVMINVLYPPTVKSMKDVSIIEGSMLNITCYVILGIPKAAAFKWTRHTDTFITDSQSLMIENISRGYSSTYDCTVTNIMMPTIGVEEKGESSGSLEIDVLYPPTVASIKNFTIIEGSHFNLSCPVSPGNPNGTTINWSVSDNIIISSTKILSFHNVSRKHDMIYTCTVSNIMKPTGSNEVKGINSEDFHLIVEYPPTVKGMKDISIIEGSMLNITCNVTLGIPKAATFRWTRREDIHITNSQLLMISNISRDLSSIYTCNVANIMKPTYGNEMRGESSNSIYIDVLYPPLINTLENLTLIEGDHLNFSCPVTYGNPNETVFLWTSEKHMTWSGQYLTIRNISRNDEMNYICSVYNIMTPTVKSYVKGKDSKMFHLSVQYNALIKDFFVNGYKFERNVTVNEYDNVIFICNIDSKPISNTSLRFMTDKTLLWTNSNFLNFTLGSAKCIDAGTYFCLGKNKHNIGVGSTEQLNIFIRCSPRANSKVPYTANLTLASNVTAVLYFPILAYPQPDSVIWQKYAMSNWISLTSNNNINISNNELNVSLSISNMMETDFGRYRLIISNDVGSYIQDYYINAEDRPTPPTGFRVLNKLTTATTATVQWFPSFNGGQPQHFVLNYTKSLQKHWIHKEIEDTGEPILIYTINGLSSNSIYYIFLYAINILGSSKLSARLEIKTKEGMHIDGDTSFVGTTIGISIGAVMLVLVLFIGIYTFRRFKLRYQHTSKNVYQNTIGPSTQKINSATEYEGIDLNTVGANIEPNYPNNTDTSTDDLPQNPYEKLDNILKDSNQYSELKPMDDNRDDDSRKSDSAPETLQKDFDKAIYMNMKI